MGMATDTRTRAWAIARAATLACALSACASGPLDAAFETGWQLRDASESKDVLAALKGQQKTRDVFAAVGISGRGIVGRALPAGALWSFDEEPNVLPSLAGDVVAFTHGEYVTVLDLETGIRRFTMDVSGRRLEGLGYNGEKLIMLLVDQDDARPDQVAIVDRRGRLLHQTTTMGRVGTPAAMGQVGLIPWDGQYVSAFALDRGAYIGRLLVRNAAHTVVARTEKPWVFGAGAVPVDEDLLGSWGDNALQLDAPTLPGEPAWPVDGSKPRPARAQPVALYAHPIEKGEKLRFAANAFAYAYYDVLVGFEHGSNTVRWTTPFGRSIAGGTANRNGPVVCLEDGSVFSLDFANGAPHPSGSLKSRLRACVVQAPERALPAKVRPPLAEQIHETITSTGPDMAAVHELLLDDLGKRKGRDTTEALLDIARDPLTSASLSRRAGNLLARRDSGGDLMLAALQDAAPRHVPRPPSLDGQGGSVSGQPSPDSGAQENPGAPSPSPPQPELHPRDKLAGSRPPPLAPLARALTQMGKKDAAPVLARHLNSPSVSGTDALALMNAIAELGDAKLVPELREFVMTHRSVGGNEEMIAALAKAVRFVLDHGSEEVAESVRTALGDLLTHPDLAKALANGKILETPSADSREPRPTSAEPAAPAKVRPSPHQKPAIE